MQRVRIFFTKRGEAAYISLLDLQRAMARALRRSGMPVWWSKGFNPHIYMSFALPLPLLQESDAESVDCRLDVEEGEAVDLKAYRVPLAKALPAGIELLDIAPPLHDADKITSALYEIHWPGRGGEVAGALDVYNQLNEVPVLRKTKRREVTEDLKQHVPALEPLGEEGLTARFPAGGECNINPALLTGFFGERFGLPAEVAQILRRQVFTGDGEIFK